MFLRFRLGAFAFLIKKICQIVASGQGERMFRAIRFLVQLHHGMYLCLRFWILSFGGKSAREISAGAECVAVVRAEHFFLELEHSPELGFGVGKLAFGVE